jgi:hypothetical protein
MLFQELKPDGINLHNVALWGGWNAVEAVPASLLAT